MQKQKQNMQFSRTDLEKISSMHWTSLPRELYNNNNNAKHWNNVTTAFTCTLMYFTVTLS